MLEAKINFVGRGNWSEIKFTLNQITYEILYDIGFSIKNIHYKIDRGSVLFTPDDVFANNPLVDLKTKKPSETIRILIISHWDLDHYSVLQELTNEELKSFDKVYAPEAHTSKTSELVIEWVSKTLGDKFEIIQQGTRQDGGVHILKGPWTLFDSHHSHFKADLYKTTYSKIKNNGGLLLTIRVGPTLLIFSGDHHYLSLKRCLEYEDMTQIKEIAIVIPHHGGLAGSLNDFLEVIQSNQIQLTWYLSSGLDHESLKKIMYENDSIELKNNHPRQSIIREIGNPTARTLDVKDFTVLNIQGRNLKISVSRKGELKNSDLALNI